MITINQWVAIAALLAGSALWYYLGKEVGYGHGYKAGERHAWRQFMKLQNIRTTDYEDLP